METFRLIFFVFLFSIGFHSCQQAHAYESEIRQAALEYNVDPDLAVAIATVESSLNPNAKGALGEQGLFQLRPEFFGDTQNNWRRNIRLGVKYLALCRRVCSPHFGSAWPVCFNRGPYRTSDVNPRATSYYKKVSKEWARIKAKRAYVGR